MRIWSSWNFYTLLYKIIHLLWKAICHFLKDLKCTPALWFSLSTPRHLFKRNECIWPHKDLYPNIHSSFICNRQNLKTIQVCINSRHCALSYKMEYYTAIKRNELLILQQCVLFSIKEKEFRGKKDILFIWNSVKWKLFRKQIRDCSDVSQREVNHKEIQRKFVADKCIHYVDCNDGFMNTYIMSKLKNCIFFKYIQFIVNSVKKILCVQHLGIASCLNFRIR